MKPQQFLHCLQLHDNGVLNKKVYAVADVDADAIIADWKWPLRLNL